MASKGEEADSPIETIDILLVEPNPGDTRLFTENFAEAKFTNTIYTVPDGESALDFLHQRGEYAEKPRPDLVLLEPQLPDVSGMEILSELENEPVLNEIPVVILTSSKTGTEIVKSHSIEADHYLQKPIEPDEFVEFVHLIEDFWLALVQRPTSEE